MSNHNWSGGNQPPHGGQPQGGYPQQPQGGYPQQGAYPNQGGFQNQPYPQQPPQGYGSQPPQGYGSQPPQGYGSQPPQGFGGQPPQGYGGQGFGQPQPPRKSRLPWIIIGALLIVGVVGVIVYFLTSGDDADTSSPTAPATTSSVPVDAETSPTPSAPDSEPAPEPSPDPEPEPTATGGGGANPEDFPVLTREDLPERVGAFALQGTGFVLSYVRDGTETDMITPLATGEPGRPEDWGMTAEDALVDGRGGCSQVMSYLLCTLDTERFGGIMFSISGEVTLDEAAAVVQALGERHP